MSRSVLTRLEREELKKSITTKANSLKAVVISEDPNWEHTVSEKSKKMALTELGISNDIIKLREIESEIKKLQEKHKIKLREIQSEIEKLQEKHNKLELKVRSVLPYQETRFKDSRPDRMSICEAVNNLSGLLEDKVQRSHPTGKKIYQIDEKKQKKLLALSECTTREEVKACGCLLW